MSLESATPPSLSTDLRLSLWLSAGMDFTKAMVSRLREAVLEEGVRGWIDDYGDVKADVSILLSSRTQFVRD